MPFHSFISYTTITASDFNDNFQFIGGGDLLPRSGDSLDTTTGIYDVGSSSYKWDIIYVNSADISAQSENWNMISQIILSTPASSIEFSGLNKEIYLITANFVLNPTNASLIPLQIIFNNDTLTSNYGHRNLHDTGTASISTSSSSGLIQIGDWLKTAGAAIIYSIVNLIICSQPGYERLVLIDSASRMYTTFISEILWGGGIWKNTTDTITSIKFIYGSADENVFCTNTSIQLWSPL